MASYASWLDSWRSSHLPEDGGYFLEAGWSQALAMKRKRFLPNRHIALKSVEVCGDELDLTTYKLRFKGCHVLDSSQKRTRWLIESIAT